jgi:hypothetical protein
LSLLDSTAGAGLSLIGSTATAGKASTAKAGKASGAAGLATAADLGPRHGLTVAAEPGARSAGFDTDLGEATPRAGLGFGAADVDAESVSGLSADATPTPCGPASDSPSANAAAPTRTAFLVLLTIVPIAWLTRTSWSG